MAAARAAVGLGPRASEEELHAAQAAVRAELLAQAVRNPELLGLLGLPAGAPAGAVRAALNKPGEIPALGDLPNGNLPNGDLPIHNALLDKATGPELVGAMLEAGGEAMLAVPGYAERLPLHWAAHNSSSPAVVALLLARGPAGAAWAQDWNGWTPLDRAQGNKGPGAEEIKALLWRATRAQSTEQLLLQNDEPEPEIVSDGPAPDPELQLELEQELGPEPESEPEWEPVPGHNQTEVEPQTASEPAATMR
jgi:hypothetical protein